MLVASDLTFKVSNISITVGSRLAGSLGAGVGLNGSSLDCLGVHPTAPPSAYAGGAATAFLAAISSAFRRISSAKRGICPTPRTRS